MSKLATYDQASAMNAITGLAERICTTAKVCTPNNVLEVRPANNKRYAEIEQLARAIALLAEDAKYYYDD